MKITNVLVTGCTSYGVGEGIIKTINMSIYRNQIKLIGASNSNLTAYKHLIDKYYILPNAKDETYLEKLNQLIKFEKIDILIPGSEAEMRFISKNEKHIETVDIWVNNYELIKTFDNKNSANEFFENNYIKCPLTYKNLNEVKNNYPVIVKPINGKSSEDIYVARSNDQLKAIKNLFKAFNKEFIVQQYLEGGDEYTISLINLNNDCIKTLIMKRILCKGATQYSVIEEDYKIEEIIRKIHNLIKNELIINIQLMKKDDEYFIFEINPRFSGSSPMRAMLGYNEFDIIFSHKYLKQNLEYKLLKNKYVIRGYNEFIFNKTMENMEK